MAMAAVGACAAFGTICGSSLATAATMGQVALPEMRKYGYSGALATGTLAAGGTLGILVPPSIPLVVYAILTEQNIAKLFLAAFIPAALAVDRIFHRHPRLSAASTRGRAPPPSSCHLRARLRHVLETWPVVGDLPDRVRRHERRFLLRPLAVHADRGGSHRRAAGDHRRVHDRRHALAQRLRSLLATAETIRHDLPDLARRGALQRLSGAHQYAAAGRAWVAGLGISPYLVMAVIVVIYILLGCLMDSLSMILLTIPIFFPVVMGLDFGLTPEHTAIWFGILALIVVELGLIHPPVGLNVYVIQNIAGDVSMLETFKGVVPFLIAEFFRVSLLSPSLF